MKVTFTANYLRPSHMRAQKRMFTRFLEKFIPSMYLIDDENHQDNNVKLQMSEDESDNGIEFTNYIDDTIHYSVGKFLHTDTELKKEIKLELDLFLNVALSNENAPLNDKSISISIDTLSCDENADYKFLLVSEPAVKFPSQYEPLLNEKNNFDKIYTYDQRLLDGCENAEFFQSKATSWNLLSELHLNKKKHISFLTSDKSVLEGHKLRLEIFKLLDEYENINSLEILKHKSPPFVFTAPFYYETAMFNIAVDNSKQENYFNEKIIHSFISKTIPIYWGCPNIGHWFNMDGIITFNTIDELKNIFEYIDEDYYNSRQEAIEENYEIALQFCEVLPAHKLYQKVYSFIQR